MTDRPYPTCIECGAPLPRPITDPKLTDESYMREVQLDAAAVLRTQLRGDQEGTEYVLNHSSPYDTALATAVLAITFIEDEVDAVDRFDAWLDTLQRGVNRKRGLLPPDETNLEGNDLD